MDENQDAVIRLYASEPSPNSISSAIQLAVRPAAISSLPEISKAGGGFVPRKIKKTRPYHGNIDGLCRRRYPSLYKEKKKEDRTENKSRDFQESISEKQNRNKECCRTFLYILAFSRSCSPEIQSAVSPAALSTPPEILKAGRQVHRPGNRRDAPL